MSEHTATVVAPMVVLRDYVRTKRHRALLGLIVWFLLHSYAWWWQLLWLYPVYVFTRDWFQAARDLRRATPVSRPKETPR